MTDTKIRRTPVDSDAMRVGAIWNTHWGYDQTNVDFFEVVRETAASIVLRRIKATVVDGRVYPLPGEFTVDRLLMGNPGTPKHQRDLDRGYTEKLCRKPLVAVDGGYQNRSVTIHGDYMFAYPYEGGGCYDTYAAGDPGH